VTKDVAGDVGERCGDVIGVENGLGPRHSVVPLA
jgi:hypothetical protein